MTLCGQKSNHESRALGPQRHCAHRVRVGRRVLASSLFALALGSSAFAQSPAPAPALTIELNSLQPSPSGCRVTFVVTNGLGIDLAKASFEMAIFNDSGVVDRLMGVDFKDLPGGKTKVSRFDLPNTSCDKITRILINDATECTGAGVEPGACIRGLKTETKTQIVFGA